MSTVNTHQSVRTNNEMVKTNIQKPRIPPKEKKYEAKHRKKLCSTTRQA
jgi:hypothetical protein